MATAITNIKEPAKIPVSFELDSRDNHENFSAVILNKTFELFPLIML